MFNKLCEGITRLMVLWVILFGMFGYFYPSYLGALRPHVSWLFAFTMLGIGLAIKPQDFRPIVTQPQYILLGTLAQFAIMPLLGFLIAKALRLPPDLAVGVILVGSAPGAMASTMISYIAKADVAYSAALTCSTTFLAPILTPSFMWIFASAYMKIEFWPMFASIMLTVILPLLIGLTVKSFFGRWIENIIKPFLAVSTTFIALICGSVVALNSKCFASLSLIIFVAVFLHNGLGLLLGYGAGLLCRFDLKRRRTVAFEVGMQNAGLGAVLALKHFSLQAALPNALFAIWCVITASVLAEYWARRTPDSPAAGPGPTPAPAQVPAFTPAARAPQSW